jgi:hypothetical protein
MKINKSNNNYFEFDTILITRTITVVDQFINNTFPFSSFRYI